jgi:hypothetical protein
MFGPWIFETCKLTDPKFLDIKISAHSYLCRVFTIGYDVHFTWDFLHEFISIAFQGIAYGDSGLRQTLIVGLQFIFCKKIQPLNMLLPVFLAECQKSSQDKDYFKPDAKKASLNIMYAAIPLGDVYGRCDLPNLENEFPPPRIDRSRAHRSGSLSLYVCKSYEEIPEIVFSNFVKCLEVEKDETVLSMAIWGLCVFSHQEFHNSGGPLRTIQVLKSIMPLTNSIEVCMNIKSFNDLDISSIQSFH